MRGVVVYLMTTSGPNLPGDGASTKRKDELSFEDWRTHFFADAKSCGLLHNAEQLGETALRLFWQQGVAPTVRALTESVDKTPAL